MNNTQSIAVYGLGNMGYPIARRIAARFPVKVFDPNAARVESARAEFGAVALRGPQDAADAGIVVLSLPSPAASQSVLRDLAPVLRKGSVVIETSTVSPDDVRASAEVLAPYGIAIIDASVMAGVAQMADGTAMLLVGGDPAHVAVCQEVLDAIASRQIRFGATGTGAAAKVINNAVAHAVMVVVAEAGAMATAAGVGCDKLIGLLSDPQMGLHRPLTYRYAERIVKGDYGGGMPVDAARKDSVLALQLAQAAGVPLFAIQGAHSVYEMAAAAGYGRDDYAAIAELWADWGKPTVPRPRRGAASE